MKRNFFLCLGAMWAVWNSVAAPAAVKDTDSPGESRFLANVRQLTFEGRRSGEGYFSSDGKQLVFQSEREPGNPFYQIYLLDFESGDTHRISPGLGKTTCAYFRPRTDEVLFGSTHHDPDAKAKQQAELDFRSAGKERRYAWDYDEQMEIYSARRDGSQLRQLTHAYGYDAEASYSPDGRQIVFSSIRDAYPSEKLAEADREKLKIDPSYFAEIYLMNADGSDQRRLTFTPGYDGGPFFSPDGQRIIWRRFNAEGTVADVHTMSLDASDVRRLTDFGCMSWAPIYHPSGQYVLFTANKLGFANFELFAVDAAGEREPVRVTFTDGFDGLPAFSPGGHRLCWTSNRTGDAKSQLFLADWNHAEAASALAASPRRTMENPADAQAVRSFPSAITAEDLRHHVGFLASDNLKGRMTGTEGSRKAAEYIADHLRRAGLAPFGSNETFWQEFEFNAGVKAIADRNSVTLERSRGTVSDTTVFEGDSYLLPLSFTDNGEAEGEVVFAGYGLSMPGKPGEGYDSYAGLNVSNRIVLAFRYVPENVEPKRRQELNRYAALHYKATIARNHGAKAILLVSGPNSPNPGALAALASDSSLAGAGIIAASVNMHIAEMILAASGKNLQALQTALDSENPHADGGFLIPEVRLKLTAGVERIKKTDRNVLAILPPGPAAEFKEYILLGAHYDHLGEGAMNTLARKEEGGQIHNGADDNASGVAAVLELAAALAAEKGQKPGDFRRGLIIALWSGEELGLRGSSHFAEHPPVGLTNIAAYLNFDMVGRLRENRLILQGVGSSPAWRRLIEKRNVAAGFNLSLQEDPYLPTDVTALYPKGIPVLNYFTGSHEDYHRPSDDAQTLNYDGLERITKFAQGIVQDLLKTSDRPEYARVEHSGQTGGARENLRAYLGTIPDYATEVTGLKLSGVRGGSPADKAGIKGGDIIVEFGGQKVVNIYDYTYALDAVKIGQPVSLVVLRDGKRVEITVTPEARK